MKEFINNMRDSIIKALGISITIGLVFGFMLALLSLDYLGTVGLLLFITIILFSPCPYLAILVQKFSNFYGGRICALITALGGFVCAVSFCWISNLFDVVCKFNHDLGAYALIVYYTIVGGIYGSKNLD